MTGIGVNAFPIDGRVFQRGAGATSGPVALSGSYSGTAPTAMQGRARRTSDGSVALNWTNLVGFSASAGAWSGSLPGVPQAVKCYVEVRAVEMAQRVVATSNNCWVGDWLVCYGQSDMNQLFLASSSPAAALDGTSYYNGTNFAAVPSANGIRNLLNNYLTYTGIPCAALCGAVNGMTIHGLSPVGTTGNANYAALAAQIAAIGGDAAYGLWFQGSGDGNAATDPQSYIADLKVLRSSLAATVGRSTAQMPFVLCGYEPLAGYNDAGMAQQQKTLRLASDLVPDLYYSHSNIDGVISGAELDAASTGRCGTRFAWSLAKLAGSKSNLAHWDIAGAELTSATTTIVDLGQVDGTDFTPTSGITGFAVSDDGGATWNTPSSVVRQNATQILLTHVSLGNNRLLRYLYGTTPDVSGAVFDNSTLALPLTPTGSSYIPFTVAGSTPIVVGTAGFADSLATSHAIPLPANICKGDLLILFAAGYDQDISTPVDGAGVSWTLLGSVTSAGGVRGAVFYKIATGVENTQVNVINGVATRLSGLTALIRGHSASKISVSTLSIGNGSAPSSSGVTASWGAANNLFLSGLMCRSGSQATPVSSYPSGYSSSQLQKSNNASNGAAVAIASKNAAAASDTPGVYTLAASVEYVAASIVVGAA